MLSTHHPITTATIDCDKIGGMPELTNERREAFCRAILAGASPTEAYRRCYHRDGHVAEAGGSRMMRFVEVKHRIAELRAPIAKEARITAASILAELRKTIDAARADGSHAAVVQSLTLAARLAGLLTDKLEVTARGPHADCTTMRELMERWSEDAGSARAALDQLERMREILIELAADEATIIEPEPEPHYRRMPWRT